MANLQRLDELIRRRATGNPEELAGRFQVHEATIYRYLQSLRELGAPLRYCRSRKTYYYDGDFDLFS